MPHWRAFMDRELLSAHDLEGKDATLEIKDVVGGEVTGDGGKKTKKPVASFTNAKKRMALNATNCKTIASLYGNEVANWAGKLITIFPSTTKFGGEVVDCLRVRPTVPQARKKEGAA